MLKHYVYAFGIELIKWETYTRLIHSKKQLHNFNDNNIRNDTLCEFTAEYLHRFKLKIAYEIQKAQNFEAYTCYPKSSHKAITFSI